MELITKMSKSKKILLAILLSAGLIFLTLSEYDFLKAEESGTSAFNEDEYILNLERRLSEIIGKMDGISDVSVMITLERGIEHKYAKETSADGISGSGTDVFRLQTSSDGDAVPILIATDSPIVKGVSVVCRGAEGAVMQNKIISLVASTLNLNRNQIYVTT